jgi:adenylate cyclase class 2
MQSAEIELKFPIRDLGRLQSLLPGLGFLLDTPRTFEQNTLYDTPGKRQPGASPNSDPSRYKVRIETETQLEDGPALGQILQVLGYAPVFRYEKFRAEWSQITPSIDGPLFADAVHPAETAMPAPRCHLVIDETPIGDYAELEGPPAWIDETLAKLGVDPYTCLTESYGRLFLNWKERTGSAAENLTFDEIPAPALLQPALP